MHFFEHRWLAGKENLLAAAVVCGGDGGASDNTKAAARACLYGSRKRPVFLLKRKLGCDPSSFLYCFAEKYSVSIMQNDALYENHCTV